MYSSEISFDMIFRQPIAADPEYDVKLVFLYPQVENLTLEKICTSLYVIKGEAHMEEANFTCFTYLSLKDLPT